MIGPVQVLVVGFDQPTFSGEVLAEFTRLREAGLVRLIDVLLVSRSEDGTLDTLEASEAAWLILVGLILVGLILVAWLPKCSDSRKVHQTGTQIRLRSIPRPCGLSRTRYLLAVPLPLHSSSTSGPLP